MAWIEVGRKDCEDCKGTGVSRYYTSEISWIGLSEAKKRWPCGSCRGSGTRSVGYQDLRDASGR